MPSTITECDNKDTEEEYFPTAPLDEEVWLKEPIPERDLCIHMIPRRQDTNHTSWACAYPQEYIPEQATSYPQEYNPKQGTANPEASASEAITWDKVLSDLLCNMPDTVDDSSEELIQEFILESWV